MDFRFSEQEEAFRREVEDFIKKELPAGWTEENLYWPGGYGTIAEFEEINPFIEQFRHRLAEKGWLTISWPEEYGGAGRSNIEQAIFHERMSYYRAPGGEVATLIGGPTILHFGSDEMKKEWLPGIAKGDIKFWLAYSEPNAGSDLASLQTRAVEDGDDLVINGQKIWGTAAHVSDYAWMVVRTDPTVPAHKGISLIIVDNKSDGITIRPLINICGFHSFNEVFFDNVRVPKKNIVGEKNQGWYYLMIALDFERLVIAIGGFRRTFEELAQYARETKRNGQTLSREPLIRNKLAEIAIEIEVAYMFFWQTAWMLDRGLVPNIEASVLKLVTTELSQKLANTGMEVMGPYGQLERSSKWTPLRGRVCTGYLDCISALVGAGTSEIQRNIIAISVNWAGPAIMLFGSEKQKRDYVTRVAKGDLIFCLGYSEPNAGSDLASLQTRAVEDGNEYVINGQKTWCSFAHYADYCWLAARTDPDAPKHKGISMFIVDMKTPGITVRPLINILNRHSFNEVFFDDVRIPKDNLVGEQNKGWYHLAVALDLERSSIGWAAANHRIIDELVQYAKETKRNGEVSANDPLIRNELAEVAVENEVARMMCYRIAWMYSKGLHPSYESSMSMVFVSEVMRCLANVGMRILGPYGQLDVGSKWAVLNARIMRMYLASVSIGVGGGSNEIQRNIIAMRGLGLPRQ